MPTGDMIWFEIWVDDLQRAQEFYADLFGWTFEPFTEYDRDNYLLIRKDSNEGINGALVRRQTGQSVSSGRSAIVYVWVNDLDKATARALARGGAVEESAKAIGTVDGTFSIIVDPDGNRVGLWSP